MRHQATLQRKLTVLGILMTWTVGSVVGLLAYLQLTFAVNREAAARVADAVRVGARLMRDELDQAAASGRAVVQLTPAEAAGMPGLAPALARARADGQVSGFALLDRGLCLVAVELGPDRQPLVRLLPLRGENALTDRIRDVVFGPLSPTARPTVTIFERDVRIATNVVSAVGERAVGTHASDEVSHCVLVQGRAWNDRAKVLDRWVIANYVPIQAIDGAVVGMLYAGLDEEPYVRVNHQRIVMFLLLIAGLTLLVSALVGWQARTITRPLAELTDAAAALAAGSGRPLQVAPRAAHEIRVLGETFSHMTGQILARTAELDASREKAQKALADYMEVLSFVAHELKSPLAGAKMQLQVIAGGFAGAVPPAWERHLASLARTIDYGLEVATSFNQLSRAEGEAFRARPRELHDFAAEVLQPAVADCESAAKARQMSLGIEGGAVPAVGDPDLLRVVCDNLIGNAIKYGRQGSTVAVHVLRTDAGMLRVEVHNEGVGVPDDKLDRLFQKFYRVQDPATKAAKGTGVGLYLVRRLIELHGGEVGVAGCHGAWIRFWFEIP